MTTSATEVRAVEAALEQLIDQNLIPLVHTMHQLRRGAATEAGYMMAESGGDELNRVIADLRRLLKTIPNLPTEE